MRIGLNRVAGLLASLLVIVGLVFVVSVLSGRPPKEQKLIKDFNVHRDIYERLREMLVADKQVRAVYARFGVETMASGVPRVPSDVNFPSARFDEYRGLLDEIGSTEVFRTGEDGSTICFAVWASGFGGDTRHVDNCWLQTSPANLVASLSEFYSTAKPRRASFVHIEGNWYLWADW
jgi:hypothetical protein